MKQATIPALDKGPKVTLGLYIKMLQELEKQYGPDMQVEKYSVDKGRHPAPEPRVAYKKIIDMSKRAKHAARIQPTPMFWTKYDDPALRGTPVIRI